MLYVYTTQSVLIYLQKRLRSVIASRHTDHGRILSGARGGTMPPMSQDNLNAVMRRSSPMRVLSVHTLLVSTPLLVEGELLATEIALADRGCAL